MLWALSCESGKFVWPEVGSRSPSMNSSTTVKTTAIATKQTRIVISDLKAVEAEQLNANGDEKDSDAKLTPGAKCPACMQGILQERYTPLGILLSVVLFPVGLICCILMKQVRCDHCKIHS